MNDELSLLKQEATDLGITFSPNIGLEKLKSKIAEYYQGVEDREDAEAESEKPEAVSNEAGQNINKIALELFEKAKKTRVVTITDNDQRVNSQTTVCQANWSNMFYDMGTRKFPLNIAIEIPQGFIDVLNEVRIPHHAKDPKTGLSATTMKPRYSIHYEDNK